MLLLKSRECLDLRSATMFLKMSGVLSFKYVELKQEKVT